MKKENLLWTTVMLLASTFAIAGGPSIQLWGGGLFGFSVGSIAAVYLSWKKNKSILWAIIHFVLGWFYVIYYLITGGTKK
ncbi:MULTISPECIES: hypothetical protein [Myroides]|uniref:hypothetical protein n=1 Tax=Myroides TaxID=76831 RepID=UPI0018EEE495|nr:hypothetical protein [Myroides phaeus]